jgi:hypothetical protein
MSALQRLAAISDATANLSTQLRELVELREQVRKAEEAHRSLPLEPRNRLTPAAQESKAVGRRSQTISRRKITLKDVGAVGATADNQLCR